MVTKVNKKMLDGVELASVAHSLNVSVEDVTLDTDTTSPLRYYVYSPQQERTYAVPEGIRGGTLQSLNGNQITIKSGAVHSLNYLPIHVSSMNVAEALATGEKVIFRGETVSYDIPKTFDVRAFTGEGTIVTTDDWGNVHNFDVGLATHGSKFTASQRINQALCVQESINLGVLGDSISEGGLATGYAVNPVDQYGNLSSLNYDHSSQGGANSWFSRFGHIINGYYESSANRMNICNASSGGKRLLDGWGLKNFDYGFFKNQAYDNRAPDVLYIGLGANDRTLLNTLSDFEDYLDEFEKLIRKAWGYGCAVAVVSLAQSKFTWANVERGLKAKLGEGFRNIEYTDCAAELNIQEMVGIKPNKRQLFYTASSTLDTTHPQQIGHDLFAVTLAEQVLTQYYSRNNIISPVGIGNSLVLGRSTTNQLDVVLEDVAGTHLDSLGAVYVCNTTENINIKFNIWVEEFNSSANILVPAPNVNTGTNVATVTVSQFTDRTEKYILDFPLEEPEPGSYATTQLQGLRRGWNVVLIEVTGTPSKVFMPYVLIGSGFNGYSFSTGRTTLTGNLGVLELQGYHGSELLENPSLPMHPMRTLPDKATFNANEIWFKVELHSVASSPHLGCVVNYKRETGRGVLISKTGGTVQFHELIGGVKGALIKELTFVTFTGSKLDVYGTITGSGTDYVVINPDNSAQIGNATSGLKGGRIAHANFKADYVQQSITVNAGASAY